MRHTVPSIPLRLVTYISPDSSSPKDEIERFVSRRVVCITYNEIKVDAGAKCVWINDKELTLTLKEYDLLLYFLANKNRVISKSAIVEHLWEDNIDQSDTYNFLYTHIKNLRRKLMDKGAPDYIQTVYGIGYNFKTN